MSIFCHILAAKARVSNIAIHLNIPQTLLKLIIVRASGGEKGSMNPVDAINFTDNHTAQGRQSCKERKKEKYSTPPTSSKQKKKKVSR